MIESINQAGGGGNATDELAKVSSNDTTAGYLNGKLVAGTGISLTENNNGGNETFTIANTAAGDTTYTVTVTDAENTSSKIDLVSFTVPANTWADGEAIWIDMDYEYLNNSGASRSATHFASGTGITETSGLQSWPVDANVNRGFQSWRFVRIGTQALSPNINFAHLWRINSGFPQSQAFVIDTSVDYTTAITLKISLQFPVANASLYLRPLLVRAYKTSAGQQ